jgi:hypothetical protein
MYLKMGKWWAKKGTEASSRRITDVMYQLFFMRSNKITKIPRSGEQVCHNQNGTEILPNKYI